eukprot:3607279-Amphidinium_carterae.2
MSTRVQSALSRVSCRVELGEEDSPQTSCAQCIQNQTRRHMQRIHTLYVQPRLTAVVYIEFD